MFPLTTGVVTLDVEAISPGASFHPPVTDPRPTEVDELPLAAKSVTVNPRPSPLTEVIVPVPAFVRNTTSHRLK